MTDYELCPDCGTTLRGGGRCSCRRTERPRPLVHPLFQQILDDLIAAQPKREEEPS
jgi:hypothetical protein